MHGGDRQEQMNKHGVSLMVVASSKNFEFLNWG